MRLATIPLIQNIPPVRAISFRLDVNGSISQIQHAIGGYVRTYEASAVTDSSIVIEPNSDWVIIEPLTAIQICTDSPLEFTGIVNGTTVSFTIRRMFISDELWEAVTLTNHEALYPARVSIAYGVQL